MCNKTPNIFSIVCMPVTALISGWERNYYIFSMCRYAQSCAFISVIELPRIPAYYPKSANFIYMLLEFQFSKLSIPSSCHSNKKYLLPNALGQSRFGLKPKRLLMPFMLFSFLLLFQLKHSLFFRLFFLAIALFTLLFVMFLL